MLAIFLASILYVVTKAPDGCVRVPEKGTRDLLSASKSPQKFPNRGRIVKTLLSELDLKA